MVQIRWKVLLLGLDKSRSCSWSQSILGALTAGFWCGLCNHWKRILMLDVRGPDCTTMCCYITSFFQRCDPEILSPQTITAIQQLRARPVRTLSNLPTSHQPTRLNTTSTQSLITTITPALLNVSDECIHNVLCVQFTGITALSCPSHQPQSFQTFPHTGMPVKIV